MVFLKEREREKKKWFVCTNIVSIKVKPLWSLNLSPFLVGQIDEPVWNLEGDLLWRCQIWTHQNNRKSGFYSKVCVQVITVAPLREGHRLHCCDVVRRLYDKSIRQTNCEIGPRARPPDHRRFPIPDVNARPDELSPFVVPPTPPPTRIFWSLCIEACVILPRVHQWESKRSHILSRR